MAQEVYIALSNPKSPTNVGAVLRAAGCYGAREIWYTGERYARAEKFQTDTKKIHSQIPLRSVEDLTTAAALGVAIVCVELAEGAIPLPAFKHPERAIYIFGPEDSSLSQDHIDSADAVVYVPTIGCMNLAATVNVVLYDRLAKTAYANGSDELVKRSRDVNNRLVVKK